MFSIGKTKRGPSLQRRYSAQLADHVITLAWSPDGQTLAAASVSGPVTLYDSRTGNGRQFLAGHGFGTTALSWHPQGKWLASAGQDGQVKLWNPANGQLDRALDGGASWVERVAWDSTGTWLAAAAGRTVRLWDATGQLLHEYGPHPSTVADIQWKPGKAELASAAYGQLALWSPERTEPAGIFCWKGSQLRLAWSPDGKYIATGDQDCTVHFWCVATAKDLMMSGYPTKVRELAWDPTGRYLATGGGSTPCVWDVSGKGPEGTEPVQLEGHANNVTALAFQHAGPLLASAGAEGLTILWHPEKTRRPLARATLSAAITQLAWSPEDQRLAVGTSDGTIAVHML